MNQVYLAFYKGRADHHGFARLADRITRLVTRGKYSHCEIAVTLPDQQYHCYSSSLRDGGVRVKAMPLPADKWDLIAIDGARESVWPFYLAQANKKYDIAGALGFVLFNRHRKNRLFCSEFCAEFLHLKESWRYSPNHLYALVSSVPAIKI